MLVFTLLPVLFGKPIEMRKMSVATMLHVFGTCKSFSVFDTTLLACQWNIVSHFLLRITYKITISWPKHATSTEFHSIQAYLYFNKQSFTSHPPCTPQSVKTLALLHKYSLLRFFTRTIITCSLQIKYGCMLVGSRSIWRA